MDRGSAGAGKPRLDVAKTDIHVEPHAGLGDRAAGGGDVEEIGGADMHLWPLAIDLVRTLTEHSVEFGHRDRDEIRMRYPGAVEPVVGFALLVVTDLGQRLLGHRGIAAIGNERRHASDGVRTTLVTGLHQQFGIGAHERRRHRHVGPIGQDEVGMIP